MYINSFHKCAFVNDSSYWWKLFRNVGYLETWTKSGRRQSLKPVKSDITLSWLSWWEFAWGSLIALHPESLFHLAKNGDGGPLSYSLCHEFTVAGVRSDRQPQKKWNQPLFQGNTQMPKIWKSLLDYLSFYAIFSSQHATIWARLLGSDLEKHAQYYLHLLKTSHYFGWCCIIQYNLALKNEKA